MKAITVRQRWAWAIAIGAKTVENRKRGFPSSYRGPVAIHAGKGWSHRSHTDPRIVALLNHHVPDYHLGAIIAVARLADVHLSTPECVAGDCHPWGESTYTMNGGVAVVEVAHLVFADIEALDTPIPCRGALGLWTPPPHVLEQLAA